ncbi:MAG: hypothetical protein WBP64_06345 [Nitrososphaeraceae archaeon]
MTIGNTDVLSRIVYVDFVRGANTHNGSKNLPADCSLDFPCQMINNDNYNYNYNDLAHPPT